MPKKHRPKLDSVPRPVRYQRSALTTEFRLHTCPAAFSDPHTHSSLCIVDISIATFLFFSADAYGCRIFSNTDKSSAIPRYNNQLAQTVYSCTPGNSSTEYEVHVLSVYEVVNRRPPSAGDATVNVVSDAQSGRPIVLVFASYQPVNWILNLPADLVISKVVLVSTH